MHARVPGVLGRGLEGSQVSLVQTRAHKHAEQGSWVQTKLLGVGRDPERVTGVPGQGRGPDCGSRLPRMQLGILGVQSRVLGQSRG